MSRRLVILMIACFLTIFTGSAYATDESVRSEIVYRASFGRADDIKLLITQGASPDQANGSGVPIIAVAAVRSDPEAVNVINALLDLGANINATDNKGQNALFYAAKAGNVDIAKVLLLRKIDAQAIDASGNNARAEAAAAGHQNIIDAMDDFVKKQTQDQVQQKNNAFKEQQEKNKQTTLKVEETKKTTATQAKTLVAITDKESKKGAENIVKDATLSLEKTPEDLVETEKEPTEIDEKKLEQAANDTLTPEQEMQFNAIIKHGIDTQPAKTSQELAAEANAKQEVEQQRKREIKSMAYQIAYHTCAFQYWVYVLQVRQSTELASEELTIAIQTQKEAAEANQRKLMVDYHLPSSFYDDITKSAQLRIYNEINTLPSNRARHENGIGKMDDMENRCEEIARQWGFPAAYKANPPMNASGPAQGANIGAKPAAKPRGHR